MNMNARIITQVAVAAGLALSLAACEKRQPDPLPPACQNGPCGGAPAQQDSGPVQQK